VRIEYVVPCKFAEVHDGLATIVGGGIDTVAVAQFPSGVQVMLAVRVVALAEELPGEHRVRCPIRDSEGNTIADDLDGTLEFPAEPPAPHPGGEGWLHNLMLPIGVAFGAEGPGSYTLHVMFDDAEYPVPFHVVGA
jgi:hypothetical protein